MPDSYGAIRQRVYAALKDQYLPEFEEILAKEKANEPVTGSPENRNRIRMRVTQRAFRQLALNHQAEYDALMTPELNSARPARG